MTPVKDLKASIGYRATKDLSGCYSRVYRQSPPHLGLQQFYFRSPRWFQYVDTYPYCGRFSKKFATKLNCVCNEYRVVGRLPAQFMPQVTSEYKKLSTRPVP